MEDTAYSPSALLGTASGSIMDMDLIDELLFDGYWLETMGGSEFLQQSPLTNNNGLCEPLPSWPSPVDKDSNKAEPERKEPSQGSLIPADIHFGGQNAINGSMHIPSQLGNPFSDSAELRRTWWIGPGGNSFNQAASITNRLITALGYIQEYTKDKDVLIQLWVPVNRGGKRVLTTSDQPFSFNPASRRLSSYRDISVNYQFSAEEDSKEMVGLPSRVFLGKVPEWTPDVRFFRSDEYPRVDHAQHFDVRGTLALPVFEQGSWTCLGVIEVVTTTQKIKYRPEIESVCKALQAVDLRSSEIFSNQANESCQKSYEAAFPEILEVLQSACKSHGLPLAQTWVPCTQQGKGGCRHSDENLAFCISPVDAACHVADPHVQGFHEACSEHHLLKGQGVAGKAFLTNEPCFSPDVTSSGKTDYPLSHHARMFGLCGAVAIRFRSVLTGTADFVLEFFLPMDCKELEEQRKMLTSLSVIIQQVCRNLRVVTDEELTDEMSNSPFYRPATNREEIPGSETVSLGNNSSEKDGMRLPEKSGDSKNRNSSLLMSSDHGEDHSIFADGGFSGLGMEKSGKQAKAEKTITLQVLRQYFAGSLKDAAKSLGVCPTTLKRICRQHGINRWPSRKIKKVGHSLQKLQVVIDSVQGASGSLPIGSFYQKFPELASPNLSTTGPSFSSPKPCNPQDLLLGGQLENGDIRPPSTASKSPSSSCSRSSSSSPCCSSGRQAHSLEDPVMAGNDFNAQLKRVRSDAELNTASQGGLGTKAVPRTQSHKILRETSKQEDAPPNVPLYTYNASQELEALRVKVTYGEDNIRFRLQKGWGLGDLWKEIGRRFSIEDSGRFDLKYLDDDSEWVLLTCDADLEECIDVSRSSLGSTIRLSVQPSHHFHGSSISSRRIV